MPKLISDSERLFLEDGVEQGIRNDGRRLTDFREISIDLDVISTSNGSSRIKNDELELIVAVKCEVASSYKDMASSGSIIVNIDCESVADKIAQVFPSFVEDDYSLYLTNIIKDMCFSEFDYSKLIIYEDQLFWNIYIDVSVISFGGNLIDWIVIGIHAALRNTIIPKIEVNLIGNNKEPSVNEEIIYSVSPFNKSGTVFPYENVPFIVSAGCIRGKVIWDMDILEQVCSKTIVALSINSEGECICMNKIYSNTLDINIIPTILNKAIEITKDLSSSMNEFFSDLKTRQCQE
ncbi:hypothetical protein FG386_001902 [Cryptosporidium ryanae]|uniref:uncharacterized protein n=1 Tax=Cryptosporidium ryanae TaxID=515981 RepID=UPI00351A043A|nr:hypothetical protein FG386_001902 [Cryptosporidium ryanae]